MSLQPSGKILTRVDVITPARAQQILTDQLFKGQRKLRDETVRFLAAVARHGEFDGGASIRFGRLGDLDILIDGQHRLHTIIATGLAQECVVTTTLVADEHELASTYGKIDRGKPRTLTDHVRALAHTIGLKMSRDATALLWNCAPIFEYDFLPFLSADQIAETRSENARMRIMEPYLDAAVAYFRAVTPAAHGIGRYLRRREIVSIGIATFVDQPAAGRACEFWSPIARDEVAGKDMRKLALEYLRGRKASSTSNNVLGPLAFGLAHAWNCWFDGVEVKIISNLKSDRRMRIAGTRWDVTGPTRRSRGRRVEFGAGELHDGQHVTNGAELGIETANGWQDTQPTT